MPNLVGYIPASLLLGYVSWAKPREVLFVRPCYWEAMLSLCSQLKSSAYQ